MNISSKYKVLFVDDEPEDRKSLVEAFSDTYDFDLAKDTEQMYFYLNSLKKYDLMLLDLELVKDSNDKVGLRLIPDILKQFPALPIVVVTKDKSADTIKKAQDAGASDFLIKTKFDDEEWDAAFRKAIKKGSLERVQDKMQRLAAIGKSKNFIGESAKILEIKRLLEAVSKSPNTPVLILGETGTGKEVAANYLHSFSPRKNKPLVAVNLSAIPEPLLESTLFGSVKGAFTGAIKDTEGYFKQANGGILLLDEIGDINHDIQIKLLRFLEDRKIRPVGSDNDVQLDVQIIAATHQDLAAYVKNGTFREDLFQRLKAMTVVLPPLRSRKQDLESLFEHYFDDPYPVKENFTPDVWEKLNRYNWPGNIRELRNVIEYGLLRQIIFEKNIIDEDCLPVEIQNWVETSEESDFSKDTQLVNEPNSSVFDTQTRPEALALLNLQYVEHAMRVKNKVKQDVADMLLYKSADSLLYDIKNSHKDFPHLFEGDAFPTIKAAYPQIFK